jgi:hypothetical protein
MGNIFHGCDFGLEALNQHQGIICIFPSLGNSHRHALALALAHHRHDGAARCPKGCVPVPLD